MQDQTRHRRAARYAPMQLMRALLALFFVLVALFRPAKAEETPKKTPLGVLRELRGKK